VKKSKFAVVLWASLGSMMLAHAGDRQGNGGDIRRFSATWAIRYVKDTAGSSEALARNPQDFPAGCSVARGLEQADGTMFAKLGSFVGSATYEWNADPGLSRCTQIFGIGTAHPRFVFSYARCPLMFAAHQIVYLILDEVAAASGLPSDTADRFAHFGNMLRAPTCLGVPKDVVRGDRIFALGEFDDPAAFARRLARIQARLARDSGDWIHSDPTKHYASWADFISGAGLDPTRLPQSEVLAEIKAWDVRAVEKLSQCSETTLKRYAPIEISPRDCGLIENEDEFQWLLLHETAHHFGYDDEASADRFAQAFSDLDVVANPIIRLRH
jgi:hypothetical protein